MVSTRKKKRSQSKRPLSQLDEIDTDFVIGQDNHSAQIEIRVGITGEHVTSNYANPSASVNGSQVDIHTLEGRFTGRVRNELDNIMVKVGTRVHDAILTAMESLVVSRVKLAMKTRRISLEIS